MTFRSATAVALGDYYNDRRASLAESRTATRAQTKFVHDCLALLKVEQHSLAATVPWLSEEVCQTLIELADRNEYATNDEEPVDARIPERTLQDHHPEEFEVLLAAFYRDIEPIVQAATGHEIESVESIQLAVYEASGGVSQGTYHTDEDSDISITVALNDDYEGGGLHILEGGFRGRELNLPPLPTGTACIFEGRMRVHKGLPVTAGKRHLLVFWCKV